MIGCIGVVVALFLCIGVSFFSVDRLCAAYLPQRLPIYPDAEVEFITHNFITEFGMGNTSIVLYTPDEPDAVRSWYGRTMGTFLREAVENPTLITQIGRQIARVDFSITRAKDGVGTQIILFGTCLN